MSLIWATRGRTWGFRFLRDAGFDDPLRVYDLAFADVEESPEAWHRIAGSRGLPEMVALRLPDPLGRRDRAGRVIPHDFVLLPPLADEVDSVEDGLRLVWPRVADEFTRIWELPKPTSPTG